MEAILLPVPKQIEWQEGMCQLPDQALILLDGGTQTRELLPAAAVIEKAMWSRLRLNWEITASNAVPPTMVKIRMTLGGHKNNARSQLYTLKINPNVIFLEANSPAAMFYAAQTLSQLVGQFGHRLPCGIITDWPDFEHRGVMLDVSRDKVIKNETLYELVDRLASLKINQLQLYTEHTYAYHNHPEVWKDASPLTGEEIIALDRYCRERFIELVPNQNSFGHMTRWLKYPRYAELAEIQGEFEVPWGRMSGPFSLAAEEPGSYDLITGLYDELLPHFSSSMVNIGCDETFDLGAGKSKAACEQRGTGRVYLDYLLRLYENLSARGCIVQFWGDILLQHPDLVADLPKDMIALEWGYEAAHPFSEHAKVFAGSGLPFYVCPGTSAWNSLAGRTDNAIENLRVAAESGKTHHAIGYLITDWGDNGHWQASPVSYLGYAVGAAYAWSAAETDKADIVSAVSRFMFDDPSGVMGKVYFDLGNLYQTPGIKLENASILNQILCVPLAKLAEQFHFSAKRIQDTLTGIDAILANLESERMTRPDAEVIRDETVLTGRLLRHACYRGLKIADPTTSLSWSDMTQDLVEILGEYKRLWLVRNRIGGLTDSVARLESLLADYWSE